MKGEKELEILKTECKDSKKKILKLTDEQIEKVTGGITQSDEDEIWDNIARLEKKWKNEKDPKRKSILLDMILRERKKLIKN